MKKFGFSHISAVSKSMKVKKLKSVSGNSSIQITGTNLLGKPIGFISPKQKSINESIPTKKISINSNIPVKSILGIAGTKSLSKKKQVQNPKGVSKSKEPSKSKSKKSKSIRKVKTEAEKLLSKKQQLQSLAELLLVDKNVCFKMFPLLPKSKSISDEMYRLFLSHCPWEYLDFALSNGSKLDYNRMLELFFGPFAMGNMNSILSCLKDETSTGILDDRMNTCGKHLEHIVEKSVGNGIELKSKSVESNQSFEKMKRLSSKLCQHLQETTLSSSLIGSIYTRLLLIREKSAFVFLLDLFLQLKKSLDVKDSILLDYFFKWIRLSTLDQFESMRSKGGVIDVTVFHENGSSLIKADCKPGDCFEYENRLYIVERTKTGLTTKVQLPIGSHRLPLIGNLSTFRAKVDALLRITKGPSSTKAFDAIVYSKVERKPIISLSRRYNVRDLNDSQKNAIENTLGQPISLIQGPPGTGKTFLLSKLIQIISQRDGKGTVLVTTPTNAACDNVIDQCLSLGLRVVRTGDYQSVRPDLKHVCLDVLVENLMDFSQTIRVLRNADVVCTTCASAGSPFLERMGFSTVIIDEASQLTETIALIPITMKSKHVVLVGDHQQLPPSVQYESHLQGYSDSMFSRLAAVTKPLLLNTQYRSHPLIMEFSSREFYKGELQSGKCPSLFIPPKGFPWPKCSKGIHKPVAYVSCNSPEVSTGTSKSNPGEAQLLVKILLRLLQAGMKPKDIGIITPYAGQIATIRSILKSHSCPPIDLNSVDAFQGREKQMILFSSVRNGTQLGFVSDYRRLNVMHTRSKSGLIVIGNENTLKKDFVWKKWFQWVKGNQLQVPVPLIE